MSNSERRRTVVLAATAIAVGFAAAERVVSPDPPVRVSVGGELEYVASWKDALPYAVRVAGDEGAPVTVLALVDLQCPMCRHFHEVAVEISAERPNEVRLFYVHYPLSYHPSALPAARAAECARDYGREAFVRWVEAVYGGQEELGDRPWSSYAEDAALPNPRMLDDCVDDVRRDERIRAGLMFGKEIGLTGTPTVLVDGWRYPGTPTREQLLTVVDSLKRLREVPEGG